MMTEPSDLLSGSRFTLRKVRSAAAAHDAPLKITLFRGESGSPCGWFIGPLSSDGGRISMPYLPESCQTLASVAVVRAIRLAETIRLPLCLVDPDDLWDRVWQA